MIRLAVFAVAVFGLALRALAVVACDDTRVARDSSDKRTASRPGQQIPPVPTVDCASAVTSRVEPRWRSRSIVVGNFGLYGANTDRVTAERWGRSALWTKIPVIVEGHRRATLRVVSEQRHRVGLTYGPSTSTPATSKDGRRGLRRAPRVVQFEPCHDRSPTAWPGGLVLATRRGVSFEVRLANDHWRKLRIPG